VLPTESLSGYHSSGRRGSDRRDPEPGFKTVPLTCPGLRRMTLIDRRDCHLEQARTSKASEGASKDPEDVGSAMPIRGVSTHAGCATLPRMRDGFHYKWVYILTSRTGTLYIGITGYFEKRIHQHKFDTIEGFTKKYQCHRLVYYESFQDAIVAITREKQIKRWRRETKIGLIEKLNPRHLRQFISSLDAHLAQFLSAIEERMAINGQACAGIVGNQAFVRGHADER
jgi:putative endonuclease